MMRILLVLLMTVAAAAPLDAQRRGAAPRRPALPAGADTNDARAYMQLAEQKIADRPSEAADAFYWAYQLDPGLTGALYGRYTAAMLSNPRRLMNYWNGERRTVRSPEVMALDSLYFRALTIDPFLYRRYETHMLRAFLRQVVRDADPGLPEALVEREVNSFLLDAGPWFRAIDAYGRGRFMESLQYYNDALARARSKSLVRAERGRLFAHVGNNESALEEFRLALEEMRREDEEDLVFLYESKALMEHGIATLHERMGNRDAAREAYGRALTEDLAFYPAHVRMAMLALAEGDTMTAVSEMDLAAQTAASDPVVHYTYGAMLAQLGRLDEAATHLEHAMRMAPFYAEPHFALGVVRDGQANTEAALQAYRGFLARAAATHRRRPAAEQRVRDLDPSVAAAAPQPSGAR